MAVAYSLIASNTVSSTVSSVTFSSIAGTYTDLLLSISARSDFAGVWADIRLQFNGSGGTAYVTRMVYGAGSSASAAVGGAGAETLWAHIPANTATSNTFGNTLLYIPNYTSGNYKTVLSDSVAETNVTSTITVLAGSMWSNTAAITSIRCALNAGDFMPYSTFYLYGILKY